MSDGRTPISMAALMVWTIQRKRADLHAEGRGDATAAAAELSSSLARLSNSSTARAARVAQLGTRVDVSSVPLRVDLDPDAREVYLTAEACLSAGVFALVVRHGLRSDWPDWGQGLNRFTPAAELVWTRRREPGHSLIDGALVWQAAGEGYWPRVRQAGGRGGRSAPYCQVVWHDRAAYLDQVRAQYHRWWHGLDTVAQALGATPSRLRRWRLDGLGAPQNPWLSAGTKKSLDSFHGS